MTKSISPFPIPAKLPSGLTEVRNYWQHLKRRQNSMPFWDDANLASLPKLADHLMLIDVFENPQRFRFNSVGRRIRKRYGNDLVHKFVDEIDEKAPIEYFTSQSSATIESGVPTYYRSTRRGAGYHRLLFPMWGNGRIEMMLGAVISATRT